VVIPVFDASAVLEECLDSLAAASERPLECIVVDDRSTDESARVALRHGATVISSDVRRGPAHARNLGARTARGDILLFLDADVRPDEHTLRRVRDAFERDAGLDAIIGSYDEDPSSPGFVSQYRNLMHCFVHRSANRRASTFWSGCGAVRRDVFLASVGFDEAYERPAIEDIELGYRLVAAGHRVELDPRLTVKHLKHWTLADMVRCDIFDRGIPWTELIWRDRSMPNDLNLRTSQRVSVALVGLALALSLAIGGGGLQAASRPALATTALGLAGAWLFATAWVVALNHRFFRFLTRQRGAGFALAAVPMQVGFYVHAGVAFAIGTARYAAGLVRARAALAPLESDDAPAVARSA